MIEFQINIQNGLRALFMLMLIAFGFLPVHIYFSQEDVWMSINAKDILIPSGLMKGTGYFGPATMKNINSRLSI